MEIYSEAKNTCERMQARCEDSPFIMCHYIEGINENRRNLWFQTGKVS